ncbi:MAG: iron chelate uptake ABC transporter family permease subunit [Mycetocola sp.]
MGSVATAGRPHPPTLRIGGWLSLPVRARSLVVGGSLLVVVLVVAVLTLTLGELGIALGNIVPTVQGAGTRRDEIVLLAFRGPRLVVGLAAGAALAVSGALFQTVTRNPLGSPDIIGITSGASAGAAAFGLLWPGILPLPAGALVGAFVAMALVFVGTGSGFSSPARMLLVGIGVSAMSLAFVQWVLVRAGREQATVLASYLNGSLAARDWDHAATIVTAVVVLVPCALLLGRRLQLIEMGDEQADALGARSATTRTLTILVAIGLAAGAALAVSGALFQTVTRNPLGSPDIIGITSGASAGAAAFGLLWPGILPLPAGALVGAFVAMALVFVGTGSGFSSPARMLLVGIGVSAMSLAFVQWVLVRAGREQATVLASYLNGSLAARDWDHVATIVTAVVVLVPCALLLSRRLQLIEMGDEQADALGARSATTRTLTILVAIGLATAAVSVAGPIAFIALVAPQIARRVTRSAGPNILASALMGAFLLSLADLVTQQLPIDVTLPVGVVTALLGGIYLGFLLIAQWNRGTL